MRALTSLQILIIALLLSSCQVEVFNPADSFSENQHEKSSSYVMLYWQSPTERMNGTPLDQHQIGGYTVRYRHADTQTYTYDTVAPSEQSYLFEHPNADQFVFEVAVFDTDGLTSDFKQAH